MLPELLGACVSPHLPLPFRLVCFRRMVFLSVSVLARQLGQPTSPLVCCCGGFFFTWKLILGISCFFYLRIWSPLFLYLWLSVFTLVTMFNVPQLSILLHTAPRLFPEAFGRISLPWWSLDVENLNLGLLSVVLHALLLSAMLSSLYLSYPYYNHIFPTSDISFCRKNNLSSSVRLPVISVLLPVLCCHVLQWM